VGALRFDLPVPDADSQPFWDAARDGRLLVQRCGACALVYAYPRPFCPACWSEDVAWVQAGGSGTFYTWSVVHRNDLPPFGERVPYCAAVVDLDEGPRMMTNLVDYVEADLAVGMAVEVTFRRETDEITLPVFRPAR
jgi:uncharacterized protein